MKAIDCATKLNERTVKQLRQAGIEAIGRYLGDPGSWKTMSPSEAKNILEAGLAIFSIWETNPTRRAYFSAQQGSHDAVAATRYAQAIGQPQGTPIYFTVDYDASVVDMGPIITYFHAVKAALNGYSVGAYGSYRVIEELRQTGAADYFYQTYAWSAGELSEYAHLYQFQNDQTVAGIRVDFDNVIKSEGVWGKIEKQPPMRDKSTDRPDNLKTSVYTVQAGDTLSGIGARIGIDYRAIKKWNGLTSDTIFPGQKLRLDKPSASPKSNCAPYPGRLIRRGSTGKDVVLIQETVGEKTDGIFGPRTEQAVKVYQQSHGLVPDGVVGPKTWSVMF